LANKGRMDMLIYTKVMDVVDVWKQKRRKYIPGHG
jgi:hypothetical protein